MKPIYADRIIFARSRPSEFSDESDAETRFHSSGIQIILSDRL